VRKRSLGKAGFDVSELALGTWGLSGDAYGPVLEVEADRVIDRALTLGITLFDTADVYGNGEMETRLGKRLPIPTTQVVTKLGTDLVSVPGRKRFDREYLAAAFERSRERLKRDVVDIVLLHNPTVQAMASSEGPAYLKELKGNGAIAAWGVSAGSAEVARAAMAKGAEVIELAYNAFMAKDLHSLSADIVDANVGVLARSVLAHGLLAGHWSGDREFDPADHRSHRWTRDELRRRVTQLDALRPVVSAQVPTLRSAALRFVLSNQLVGSAVLGPRSGTQLHQLVREAGAAPPYLRDTALAELSERLKDAGVPLG
jgi:aryl-alcohol dehydrogenase-like predicted oxidoreductase